MKHLLCIILALVFLSWGNVGAVDTRCPLTGNTYVFSMDGVDFELSGIECTFGPGCEATADLWYGIETGPKYYLPVPFVCEPTGDIRITVGEIELPCALNSKRDLECFTTDISGYVCTRLGSKMWCLPEKPGEFVFTLEE
ncbi:MAG: hypothetical protein IMF11_13735 [Proteobacteria bacterium]|nr:hypothetical protein [Pseudomonadota bacterium]